MEEHSNFFIILQICLLSILLVFIFLTDITFIVENENEFNNVHEVFIDDPNFFNLNSRIAEDYIQQPWISKSILWNSPASEVLLYNPNSLNLDFRIDEDYKWCQWMEQSIISNTKYFGKVARLDLNKSSSITFILNVKSTEFFKYACILIAVYEVPNYPGESTPTKTTYLSLTNSTGVMTLDAGKYDAYLKITYMAESTIYYITANVIIYINYK